ncbi:MAG: SAM-dependent methyltransferase [Alphaproteobacteria bacterium]
MRVDNALAGLIKQRIKASAHGMGIAEFMALCLYHPDHGYYMKTAGIGSGLGAFNFTTAPEISPLFGELLAFHALESLEAFAPKGRFRLIEIGAGRGSLLLDMLHIFEKAGITLESLELVEISPVLQQIQQERLHMHYPHLTPRWHQDITSVPTDYPWLFIANEVFDALPIDQFYQDGTARNICHDGQNFHFNRDALPETITESSAAANALAAKLGAGLIDAGGMGIIIDYGYQGGSCGDTLQALYQGRPSHPLRQLGDADLTAQVDFDALHSAFLAAGLAVSPLATQGDFLQKIGAGQALQMRLAQLRENAATPNAAAALHHGALRLIAPNEMGNLFKILEINAPPP